MRLKFSYYILVLFLSILYSLELEAQVEWEELKSHFPHGEIPMAMAVEATTCNNLILTYNKSIFVTLDGGSTWENLDVFCDSEIRNIKSLADGVFINNGICRSEDGGVTWHNVFNDFGIEEHNCPNVIVFGDDGEEQAYDFYIVGEAVLVDRYKEFFGTFDSGRTYRLVGDLENGQGGRIYGVSGIGVAYECFYNVLDDNRVYLTTDILFDTCYSNFSLTHIESETSIEDFSYAEDGHAIVMLTKDNRVLLSLDNGDRMKTVDLEDKGVDVENSFSIYMDIANNVYLYSDSKLYFSCDLGDSWKDITPVGFDVDTITDVDVSWDGFLFVSTIGTGVLKSKTPVFQRDKRLVIEVYEDSNNNCVKDVGEKALENIKMKIDEYICKPTDENGVVDLAVKSGIHTIEVETKSQLYRECTGTIYAGIKPDIKNDTVFFAMQLQDECANLRISTTLPFLERCKENTLYVDLLNEGNVAASDIAVDVTLDRHFDFNSTDMDLLSISGDRYTFKFNEVLPGEQLTGTIEFDLACDVELGIEHHIVAVVNHDNSCIRYGGIDTLSVLNMPNSEPQLPLQKNVILDGNFKDTVSGDRPLVEYLIKFQNTTNDTVFTVRIEDEINPNLTSYGLMPISASHDYEWLRDKNKLIFCFNDIQLVDSLTNEAESHGFIKFQSYIIFNSKVGSLIENTANVYFDANEPVPTNTAKFYYRCQDSESSVVAEICPGEVYYWETADRYYDNSGTFTTTLKSVSGCDSIIALNLTLLYPNDPACILSHSEELNTNNISVFPNPASDLLYIENATTRNFVSYTINKINGEEIQVARLTDQQISLVDLESGVYFLTLLTGNGEFHIQRFTIMR